MKRFTPAVLLLLAAACAPVTSDPAISGSTSGTVVRDQVRLANAAGAGIVTLAEPVERVWSVMPAVYAELGLPVSTLDPAQKVILTLNQRVSRIDGKRLSTFFRCSGTHSNVADNGNTQVTVRTQIAPGATGATVHIEVRAVSHETGATTGGQCGTMGTLERLVAATIIEKSSAPTP